MVSSGRPGRAVAARDLAREHGAHGAVDVADGQLDLDGRAVLERLAGVVDQLVIERLVEAVILRLHAAPGDAARASAGCTGSRKGRGPWPSSGRGPGARPACRRGPPFRRRCGSPAAPCTARTCSAMKKKKLMTCSGCPWNLARSAGSCVAMPTGQVLRWHLRIMMQPMATSGAVEKPNSSAPSSAAMTTSRPVCSLPSVCTRMRPRRSFITSTWCVSARPSSQGTPACLMELSGEAPVPPRIAADQHHVGMRLGHARGHRAHAHFGHQLDRDARLRVDVLQIVDELRQIFDGVDVVVRRRRDQAHAGDGVAHARDGLIHLVAGKLAAFAGLGALRHLDLQLVGVDQVIGGDAEAARRPPA